MVRSPSQIIKQKIRLIIVIFVYVCILGCSLANFPFFQSNQNGLDIVGNTQSKHEQSPSAQTTMHVSKSFQQILMTTQVQGGIEAWSSPHQIDCEQFAKELHDIDPVVDEVFKETLTEPPFIMNIHHPSKDDVSKRIWEDGCWECDHVKTLVKALSHYSGSYFLDIGGNIGMWSLSAAAANYQTFTIEPLPENYVRFCRSVNKNSFHNRTHLINVAATDRPANFRLELSPGNMGGTRVVPVDDGVDNTDNKNTVHGVTVDSLNLPTNYPVVLKLDVEGHELMALTGATQFIKNADIVYAMMELRPNLKNDSRWNDIFRMLVSKGLKPYRINYDDETPLDVDQLDKWKHFKHPKVRYFDVAWRLSDFTP